MHKENLPEDKFNFCQADGDPSQRVEMSEITFTSYKNGVLDTSFNGLVGDGTSYTGEGRPEDPAKAVFKSVTLFTGNGVYVYKMEMTSPYLTNIRFISY